MDEQLTTKQAANALGISRQRLHVMAKSAGITPVPAQPDATSSNGDTPKRRRFRWLKSDILKLAERRRENLRRAIDKALSGPML